MGLVPVVLLARSESSGVVYALERQENGLYVICRLGNWVDLIVLAKHATVISRERLNPPAARPSSRDQVTTNAITTPQIYKDQKIKRAAIEAIQSLVKKRARSQSVCTLDESAKQEASDPTAPTESHVLTPQLKEEETTNTDTQPHHDEPVSVPVANSKSLEESSQQTADAILDNIKTHYFDALYKSMVRSCFTPL